jgi:hypothetical protein
VSDNPAGPQGGSGQDNPFGKPPGGGYGAQGQNPAQPQYGQPAYGQNQPQYGQNQPQYGQNPGGPPYGSSYGQQPAGYPAGGYPGQQGQRENPGRTLGITGLVLAFIPFLNPIGLILSIVALVKSRRAGMSNGLAVAGIIVGALATIILVLAIILIIAAVPYAREIAEFCEQNGPGPHTFRGQQIDCP